MLTPFAILPCILVFTTVSISHVIDYAHSDCFSLNALTSWLTTGKLKRKFRVNDNLAATLGDSLVDYSALLNTVGSRYAASEQARYSGQTIHIILGRINFTVGRSRSGFRRLLLVDDGKEFLASHLPQGFVHEFIDIHIIYF